MFVCNAILAFGSAQIVKIFYFSYSGYFFVHRLFIKKNNTLLFLFSDSRFCLNTVPAIIIYFPGRYHLSNRKRFPCLHSLGATSLI